MPPFEPGAHVDLHLPDGTIRQYSLWGDPQDRSRYRLGIRAVHGGLSSGYIHKVLRPGEILTVSSPRNNFPFVDASRYIFIGGGIGITPLMPMLRAASRARRPWTLFYCNRRNADAPFLDEILSLGGQVSLHCTEAGTRLDVMEKLVAVQSDTIIYCCGPERLMNAVENATVAWPEGSVRFERFAPRTPSGGGASGQFEVVCATSKKTVIVPPDQSILAALTEAGIELPRSCEQGICGTCEVRVLEGEIDHRDSILSAAERATNSTMMTCVSRARGARLVLEI